MLSNEVRTAMTGKWYGQFMLSIAHEEYGDIRSILDEFFHPKVSEEHKAELLSFVNGSLDSATFSYDEEDGWGYEEGCEAVEA